MPYPSRLGAGESHRCRAPGNVPAPTRRAAVALPARAERVRTVRHFTSQALTHWGVGDDDRGAAVLIVSELAGNAAQHGRSDMEILLALAGSALHLVVADSGGSADTSVGRFCGSEEHYGRGLSIVRSLAERLTVRKDPEGWRVGVVLRTRTVRGNHQQVGAEGE